MMNPRWPAAAIVVAGIFGATLASAADVPPYKPPPGPYAVKNVLLDWKDAQRDRSVPVKIYYPDVPRGKFPVIVFSHGLGGSREGYGYLGQFWASNGYVCVHLQHIGSDTSVWSDVPADKRMAALGEAAASITNFLNRAKDVKFALDQLEQLNKEDPVFKSRLDLDHILMAGHYFGANTTLTAIGEVYIPIAGKKESTLAEARIKAAVAMCEPVPASARDPDRAFGKIAVPCLHMTGTRDDSPIGSTKAADRRIPFDHIPPNADQFLLILNGGDHMVFAGLGDFAESMIGKSKPGSSDLFHRIICQSTLAFWDAYLKSDAPAHKWLSEGPCKQFLGDNAAWEQKLAPAH